MPKQQGNKANHTATATQTVRLVIRDGKKQHYQSLHNNNNINNNNNNIINNKGLICGCHPQVKNQILGVKGQLRHRVFSFHLFFRGER